MIAIPNDLLAKLMTIAAAGYAQHPEEATAIDPVEANLLMAGFDELTPEGLWATGELESLMANDRGEKFDACKISPEEIKNLKTGLRLRTEARAVAFHLVHVSSPVELIDQYSHVVATAIVRKILEKMVDRVLCELEVTEVVNGPHQG